VADLLSLGFILPIVFCIFPSFLKIMYLEKNLKKISKTSQIYTRKKKIPENFNFFAK
jgi:hypothetical protein